MKENIINCYELDLKQDIPEELKLTQEQCQSLNDRNRVLTTIIVILGFGLTTFLIYNQIVERRLKQKSH